MPNNHESVPATAENIARIEKSRCNREDFVYDTFLDSCKNYTKAKNEDAKLWGGDMAKIYARLLMATDPELPDHTNLEAKIHLRKRFPQLSGFFDGLFELLETGTE